MGESVAMEAIHRAFKKRSIQVQQQECQQATPRRNVPFNQDVESIANTSMADTLLVAATFRGHVACMRLLLNEHGANCSIAPEGWVDNLVSIAILSRNIDAVKLLIDAGADMDRPPLQDEYIQNRANGPLAIAIMDEHVPSVELLLQRGADSNVTIYNGSFGERVDDPWEFATRHEDRGQPRLLEIFLRHGMFPDHSSYEQGRHPVILALRAFNVECAAILVRAGAVPEDYDEYIQSDTDSRFLWAAEEVRNMLNEWERQEVEASKAKGKIGAVRDWLQRIRLKTAKK
ncbi:ankyrin repeat-containing domain protein [Aspergillus insuetus]